MTLWKNLVVALVAAFVLAACSSSDNDPAPTDTGMEQTADERALAALQQEIAALRAQLGITDDDDIGDSIADLMEARDQLRQQLDDAADTADAAAEAMGIVTAAKLYAGIYAPAVGEVHADYDANGNNIVVTMGDGTSAVGVNLSEDEDTMVAANRGWAGKRYADPAGGDMVEAYVYSNVEAPTMGKKFGGAAANDEFEYALTDGALPSTFTYVASRVALTGVTRTAGTETFNLPDPNPNNEQIITVPGSYHGVSGTYSCDTGSARTDACSASVAAEGLMLAGTWSFMPTSPNARVMEAADMAYASYGWWISKAENDGPFTASVFTGRIGADPTALDIAALRGTATYSGGAAGKYALSSSTGGTNDAGHFTADVELNATFGDTHTISGTVDNFTGADGNSRDWSVALNSSIVSDTGEIAGDPDDTSDTGAQMTVWTRGGTAGDASGQWSGDLAKAGDDTIPTVATGTFYSEFGRAGKMVGAFGANLD